MDRADRGAACDDARSANSRGWTSTTNELRAVAPAAFRAATTRGMPTSAPVTVTMEPWQATTTPGSWAAAVKTKRPPERSRKCPAKSTVNERPTDVAKRGKTGACSTPKPSDWAPAARGCGNAARAAATIAKKSLMAKAGRNGRGAGCEDEPRAPGGKCADPGCYRGPGEGKRLITGRPRVESEPAVRSALTAQR